jgi:hypothetical protein
MSAAFAGYLVGCILIPLGVAAIWLLVAWAIPSLRHNPKRYPIAMVLATLTGILTSFGGQNVYGFLGSLLVVGILWVQMRRRATLDAARDPR